MTVEELREVFPHSRELALSAKASIFLDVWRSFAESPLAPVDVIVALRPDDLTMENLKRSHSGKETMLVLWDDYFAMRVGFDLFFTHIVPLTGLRELYRIAGGMSAAQIGAQLKAGLEDEARGPYHIGGDLIHQKLPPTTRRVASDRTVTGVFRAFALLAVRLGYLGPRGSLLSSITTSGRGGPARWLHRKFEDSYIPHARAPYAESVSTNRKASIAVRAGRNTVKADAAVRVFDISCSTVTWAVLDTGIDANHPAFRRPGHEDTARPFESRQNRFLNRTRIKRTYNLANGRSEVGGIGRVTKQLLGPEQADLLRVSHDNAYLAPRNDHGTHVAGILGANWQSPYGEHLRGVCSDIGLIDIRVLNERGEGTEFDVIQGLKLVRSINEHAGRLVIHGVNLSLSIPHDVANFACGWSPICRACEDLIASGVVVVAAAGNAGFAGGPMAFMNSGDAINTASITDPGNAEGVITVGATSQNSPHRFGTSYFSSRGPTADGRPKPDLLAPGEGIVSTVPDGFDGDERSYNGTSQAAPHVSGAAALLLARYPELRGQPHRVKEILCSTATDLGRDRYFQGFGMVDALRALQSV